MFRGKKAKAQAEPSLVNNEANLQAIFDEYADPDDNDYINMDGISRLSEALGLDASADVKVLVLMWRLGASTKPGMISRSEFLAGMKALNRYSIHELREMVPSFDPGFLERAAFREFFRFVFVFSREGTHKTLEKDVVMSLLPIVIDHSRAPHLQYFLEFLREVTGAQHHQVTLDQWDSFLQFQSVVKLDLKGYEDDGAWPLLLDDYVTWRRASMMRS